LSRRDKPAPRRKRVPGPRQLHGPRDRFSAVRGDPLSTSGCTTGVRPSRMGAHRRCMQERNAPPAYGASHGATSAVRGRQKEPARRIMRALLTARATV
jgi:hypothetical protein